MTLSKLHCSLKARSSESAFLFLNRSWYKYNLMDKEKFVFVSASYLTLMWNLKYPASRPKQNVDKATLLRNAFHRFHMQLCHQASYAEFTFKNCSNFTNSITFIVLMFGMVNDMS